MAHIAAEQIDQARVDLAGRDMDPHEAVHQVRKRCRKVRTPLNRRQKELRSAALPLGQRLFAEKPKAFVRRVERLWYVWRT